jgi:hypothetical protein
MNYKLWNAISKILLNKKGHIVYSSLIISKFSDQYLLFHDYQFAIELYEGRSMIWCRHIMNTRINGLPNS